MAEDTRYHVYFSYNEADLPAVETLARRLVQEGIQPWVDEWNMIPGELQQEARERGLLNSDTCAVCIGPSGTGPWQTEEMRIAIDRRVNEGGFRVIPVLLPGAQRGERSRLPDFLIRTRWVEFHTTPDDATSFHRLVCGIRGVEPGPTTEHVVYAGQCPYRGLRYFDVEHAPFFFGREALTDWLLDAIRPSKDSVRDNRFLAVIGSSGSGKSSLARAGLVASIKRGALPGSESWPVAICRPGINPLESLAVAMAGGTGRRLDSTYILNLEHAFGRDHRTLHIVALSALDSAPAESRFVILVDQFEEVFNLCRDAQVAEAFTDNLLHAAQASTGKTIIVLTLRADYYGRCSAHNGLASALSDHQLLIGAPHPEELRRAVEQPAHITGVNVETGLTELLLRDIEHQPGGLPLLQHTLFELWQRNRHRLTIDAYRTIGGMSGALEQRAEGFYGELDESERELCQRIFLRLVQPGKNTEDTRRRSPLDELIPLSSIQRDKAEALVHKLASEQVRLITVEGDAVGRQFVEVAHESLIRGWPRLRAWIDDNRRAITIHHRLSDAAAEWSQHSEDASYLYRGSQLLEATTWGNNHPGELTVLEQRFLDASISQQRNEKEAQENLRELPRLVAARESMLLQAATAMDLVHRMNNLLGTIPIWAHRTEERLAELGIDDGAIHKYIRMILSDSASALDTIAGLRNPPSRQLLNVGDILKSLALRARVQTPHTNQITVSCLGTMPSVYALESEVTQAFWNVLWNAVEAMSQIGGAIEIGCESFTDPTGKTYVEVKIRDQGPGIPADMQARIFEPFVTSRLGHMGYGLWRTKTIVESLEGSISVQSELGLGSTFVIRLPGADGGTENE